MAHDPECLVWLEEQRCERLINSGSVLEALGKLLRLHGILGMLCVKLILKSFFGLLGIAPILNPFMGSDLKHCS